MSCGTESSTHITDDLQYLTYTAVVHDQQISLLNSSPHAHHDTSRSMIDGAKWPDSFSLVTFRLSARLTNRKVRGVASLQVCRARLQYASP